MALSPLAGNVEEHVDAREPIRDPTWIRPRVVDPVAEQDHPLLGRSRIAELVSR